MDGRRLCPETVPCSTRPASCGAGTLRTLPSPGCSWDPPRSRCGGREFACRFRSSSCPGASPCSWASARTTAEESFQDFRVFSWFLSLQLHLLVEQLADGHVPEQSQEGAQQNIYAHLWEWRFGILLCWSFATEPKIHGLSLHVTLNEFFRDIHKLLLTSNLSKQSPKISRFSDFSVNLLQITSHWSHLF